MRLSEFTTLECLELRMLCNFTPEEQSVFDLRVRDYSITQISLKLNLSERTVNRRLKEIKRKIYKAL